MSAKVDEIFSKFHELMNLLEERAQYVSCDRDLDPYDLEQCEVTVMKAWNDLIESRDGYITTEQAEQFRSWLPLMVRIHSSRAAKWTEMVKQFHMMD